MAVVRLAVGYVLDIGEPARVELVRRKVVAVLKTAAERYDLKMRLY